MTPVYFVRRNAKCPCFIYSSIFQKQFHKEIKVVFFSLFSLFLNNYSLSNFPTVQNLLQSSIRHQSWVQISNIKEKVKRFIC